MFQILVTKPATQAVFLVTIFLLKLKQSLRIGSGGHRQTDTIPKSGYVIVFGLQGFKETGGTVEFFYGTNRDSLRRTEYSGVT